MKRFIALFSIILSVAGTSYCGPAYFVAEDSAPVLRVMNGYTGTVTIVITNAGANNITVTADGFANTIGPKASVTALAAALTSVTNLAGEKKLTVDASCSVGSDVYSNAVIIATTNTILTGKWGNAGTWDTSVCKFFLAYQPPYQSGNVMAGGFLDRIYGSFGGTGPITVSLYVDDAKVYSSVLQADEAATTNEVKLGQFDSFPKMTIGGAQPVLLKAARATTATTGSAGLVINNSGR